MNENTVQGVLKRLNYNGFEAQAKPCRGIKEECVQEKGTQRNVAEGGPDWSEN